MVYDIQDCIGARLRRMSRQVDSEYRSCLKRFNITENQLTILFTLSKTGQIEQGKLGAYLGLEKSSISRTIRLLETTELVERSQDYRPDVKLTKKGEKEVKKLLPEWEGIMDRLQNKIGDDGMQSLKIIEQQLR